MLFEFDKVYSILASDQGMSSANPSQHDRVSLVILNGISLSMIVIMSTDSATGEDTSLRIIMAVCQLVRYSCIFL